MRFMSRLVLPPVKFDPADETEFAVHFKRPGVAYLILACMLTFFAAGAFFVADYLSGAQTLLGTGQQARLLVVAMMVAVTIFLVKAPGAIVLRYYSYVACGIFFFIIQIAAYVAYSSRVESGAAELFWALTSTLVSSTIGIYGLARLNPNYALAIAMTGLASAMAYVLQSGVPIVNHHVVRLLVHLALANCIGYVLLFAIRRRERALFALSKENERRNLQTQRLSSYAEDVARQKSLAEAAVVAKDRFLATMSHEIRTPMNAIITSLRLLPKEITAISARGKELLAVTNFSSEALLGLLNDILLYARHAYGGTKIDIEEFDVHELLGNAVNIFESNAALNRITLSCDTARIAPQHRMLRGDAQKLRQIVLNLVGNAVKFTRTGGVVLRANVSVDEDRGASLNLTIRDTGCGIPQHFKGSVFQPFSQADNTDQRPNGGTGLGLAITKQLVEILNGTIDYDSTDSGTEFRVGIPVALCDNNEPKGEQGTLYTPASPNSDRSGIDDSKWRLEPSQWDTHILLVDDNAFNAQVMGIALEAAGFTVSCATGGAEAIARIKHGDRFGAIVMDIQMPDVDGYAATRAIRQLERDQLRRAIPIVALTANASDECRNKCMAAEMDGYFTKPVDPDELCQALRTLMRSGS